MTVEDRLKEFISTEIIPHDAETSLTLDEPLVSSGRVDSLGLLNILAFIDQRYNVDLFSVAGPKDFDSISSLAQAIARAQGND